MSTKKCIKSERPHTEIRSQKQRGLFGAELARRRAGETSRMKSITTEELESHLRESKGKKLPAKAKTDYLVDISGKSSGIIINEQDANKDTYEELVDIRKKE